MFSFEILTLFVGNWMDFVVICKKLAGFGLNWVCKVSWLARLLAGSHAEVPAGDAGRLIHLGIHRGYHVALTSADVKDVWSG